MWMLYFKQFFCRTKDGAVSVGHVVSQRTPSVGRRTFWQHVHVQDNKLKLFWINKIHISPNVLSLWKSNSLSLALPGSVLTYFPKRLNGCREWPHCDWAVSIQLFQWPLTFHFLCLTGAPTAQGYSFQLSGTAEFISVCFWWLLLAHIRCTCDVEYFWNVLEIIVWLKLFNGAHGLLL